MLRPSFLNSLALILFSFLIVLAQPAEAAKVKVWDQHAQADFEKAKFKQAVVSSEGALRLSRQLRPLTSLAATRVWAVVEDKAGNLYAATGDEGKLFKITPDGKAKVLYTSPDSQLLCLALGQDGSIYAGSGPKGFVVQISPSGKPRILAEDLDAYVWGLVHDPETGTLYAGTGPKGRIFEIARDAKPRVFYTTKQDHVLCLAQGPDKMLYAGTDKDGLVYRIDPRGKGFVLYQAKQAEVRSLLVSGDGVYAGTSDPVKKRTVAAGGPSGTPSASSGGGGRLILLPQKETADAEVVQADAKVPAAIAPEPKSKGAPASASGSIPPGTNSLYRIAADGTVRELFRTKALLLSLSAQNGRLLVGTGMEGQLFEIDETNREKSEIARLDHGQIQCLLLRRDGSLLLGTGDPGKLYVMEDRFAAQGTILSEVLDAKIVSKWGALTWRADLPAGTSVSIAARSGNVAEPDDTWSDWSAEQSDPQQARALAPAARFLQYRVTLKTDIPRQTPEVRGLTVRYQTTNQAPEISSLNVPDLNAGNLDQPRKLKVKWSATDANEDELTYQVHVRKDGWKSWVMLEEDLEKREFEWDTSTAPAGVYRLKVVASDRRDNPAEEALLAERISAPVTVAHVPPTVTIKVAGLEGTQAVVEATAVDPLVRLTEASFTVNGKRWVNTFPVDGLFDSKTESFRFKTEVLRPGTYVLVLRVKDAAGNVGSGDVVFTVQEKTGR